MLGGGQEGEMLVKLGLGKYFPALFFVILLKLKIGGMKQEKDPPQMLFSNPVVIGRKSVCIKLMCREGSGLVYSVPEQTAGECNHICTHARTRANVKLCVYQ